MKRLQPLAAVLAEVDPTRVQSFDKLLAPGSPFQLLEHRLGVMPQSEPCDNPSSTLGAGPPTA